MPRVKCPHCQEWFKSEETNHVYSEKIKRYFHTLCYEEISTEWAAREELVKLICDLFKIKAPGPKINNQIKRFLTEYDYTYEGMHNAIKYFFIEKENSIEKSNGGIGIVPYVYEEANNFYRKKKAIEKKIDQGISKFSIDEENRKVVEIDISKSRAVNARKSKKQIDIENL